MPMLQADICPDHSSTQPAETTRSGGLRRIQGSPVTYAKCADAYADGRADIPIGDPAYAPKLDRDNDGVACERDQAPAGFTPRTQPTPQPSTSATVQAGTEARLPQTGPGEVTAAGALVVVMGAVVVLAFKRRRTRFTA